MKKVISLLLALVLVLGLTACGGNNNQSSVAPSGDAPASTAATKTDANWPTQTITILEPYAAGSTSDLTARQIAAFLEEKLGVPCVVQNVVGADGATCYTQCASAKPDGYTLVHVQHSGICIGVFLSDLGFKAEDFYYFGSTNPFDHCVSVRTDMNIKNLDELMEWAKDQDTIKVAYSGYVNVFNAINLFKTHGLEDKLVCVAYDDSPAAAVVAGDCDVCVWQKAGTRTTAESGGLEIIAALATERWADIPDVPTAREQGYDVISIGHAYLGAPAGTPQDVLDKIQVAFDECIASDKYREEQTAMGWTNRYLNHQEATDYIFEQREIAHEYLLSLGLIEK